MPSRQTSYHHGDARAALLEAAAALLESGGAAALSLRQVAENAGLSRQAPYNHFKDKEAMLAELVREGFERLRDRVKKAGQVTDDQALTAVAAAYIGFGQKEPALFRLMFSRELVELSHFPGAQAAAADAFGQLSSVVARTAGHADVEELSLAAWCLVHGYTTLCVETQLEAPDRRADRARAFARIIEADIASRKKRR